MCTMRRFGFLFLFVYLFACSGSSSKMGEGPDSLDGGTGTDDGTTGSTQTDGGDATDTGTHADSGSSKSIFRGEFPLTAQFRNGPTSPKDSYEKWEIKQPVIDGHLPDLVTHALVLAPENYEYANTFAGKHPDTLFLSTWRAASGTPLGVETDADRLERSQISFPGHWVLRPGSRLSQSLSASDGTMTVASGDGFAVGPALLVEVDPSGEKLWDRFEYVMIAHVQGTALTIERAFNGSPPARAFPAGTTEVAPIAWDSRAKYDYNAWFFNITKDCPRDSENRTAMDLLVEPMVGPYEAGGALSNYGGLDLASGPWGQAPQNADYDGDGVADPDEVYYDGVRTFFERVWAVLGDEGVVLGSLEFDYLGFISGVNQEGLARPADPWREVSRTVNEVLAWGRLSSLPMVSLAFVQYLDDDVKRKPVQMQRLLSGYSACLGLAADLEPGDGIEALGRIELFKGDESEAHWLGKALAPVIRTAARETNLLGGVDHSDFDAMTPNLVATKGTLVPDGDELLLRADANGNATLELHFTLTQKSDFTVFFEARSEDGQLSRQILLPRVSVPVETEPVRARITSRDYLPVSNYIRGAEPGEVTIDFRFDDGGDVRLRSISAHAAPDALAREFERGVVLVNPSLGDVTFDLTALFPGRSGFRRLSASPPAGEIAPEYQPQLEQALALNNGQPIAEPSAVVVPERNALFLIADEHPAP